MGCGAAFFDYDNDGWLDILVLSGSRFGDPLPTASNRLYKNNRDGTFADLWVAAQRFLTTTTMAGSTFWCSRVRDLAIPCRPLPIASTRTTATAPSPIYGLRRSVF